MIHEVLRAFHGEGRDLTPGDLVETAHWRNEEKLINLRKLGIPKVPQAEYEKLVAINVAKTHLEIPLVITPPVSLEIASPVVETSTLAPKSSKLQAISTSGVEKPKSQKRRGRPPKNSVPKRIPPRKSKEA